MFRNQKELSPCWKIPIPPIKQSKMDKQSEEANQNPNHTKSSTKGRSCKGCLYYSSLQKSKSQNPTCVVFYKTLNQVPSYIVGETELEASKADRTLTDFKYGCVGYSVFLDRKDSSDPHNKQAELPFCVGLEVLYDKRPAGQARAPTPARTSEDNVQPIPQPRSYKPHSPGDEYLTRFRRNAGLVASGVARNLNRVGNHIKQSVDNILFGRSK